MGGCPSDSSRSYRQDHMHQMRRWFSGLAIVLGLLPVTFAHADSNPNLVRKQRKEMVLIGGAGERRYPQNVFDSSLRGALELARDRHWNVSAIYDIEHPASSKLVRSFGTVPSLTVTQASDTSVQTKLDRIRQSLSEDSDEWKAGDQLWISIASHGARPDPSGAATITGPNSRSYLGKVLGEIAALAKNKGIKVAITFDRCAATDAVLDMRLDQLIESETKNTICIAASSTRDRGTIVSAKTSMTMEIKNADNLEVGFRNYRRHPIFARYPFFPQIWTPSGLFAENETRQFNNTIFFADERDRAFSLPQCDLRTSALSPETKLVYLANTLVAGSSVLAGNNSQDSAMTLDVLDEHKQDFDELKLRLDSISHTAPGVSFDDCVRFPYDDSYLDQFQAPNKERFCSALFKLVADPKSGSADAVRYTALAKAVREKVATRRELLKELDVFGQRDVTPLIQTERNVWDMLYEQYEKEHPSESNACRDFKI